MKKRFSILLALVIAFFALPFGGNTTLADEEGYGDIEDGDYKIDIKLLKKGTDESSAAAGFMNEKATLIIEDEKLELTFYIPDNPAMSFNKFEVEELEPATEEVEDMFHYTFKLNELKTKLSATVSYEVPAMNLVHEDVDMDIELVGLDELPKEEEEEPEEAPEEREVDKLLTEKEADAVYKLNYETDSDATAGQLKNPVKLLEKGNKKYVQIEVDENGAPLFRSLKINEKEVTWNSITEGPYTVQFELPNGVEDELEVSMVIQAGPKVMPHDDIKLWFDEDSLETIKEPEAKPEKIEIEQGAKTPVKANDTITVKDSQGTQLTMPDELPSDAKVTINSAKDKVENEGDLKVAGDVLEFDFEGIEDFEGTFELVMGYDQDKFNSDDYDVDLYYFNEEGEWVSQEGTVKDGKITATIGHFSTYGVFAKKIKSSDDTDEGLEVPEDAKEVDYKIMHENGKEESTADSFFEKPGLLFEKDGKQYVQVTVTSSDMVRALSSEHGDAVIVNENDDGSMVVQFRVNDDLSDTLLEMRIVVPGMYESTHEAIFAFTSDEKPEEDPKEEEPNGEDPTEDPKEEPKEKPKKKDLLKPDKAYEIDYDIYHEDGSKPSISNDFFEKPALLFEKDGKKYIQMKITNGDMIKELRNKYGNALLVKEEDDGSVVVQLRVNDDLSDMLLDMHIIVPSGAIPGFPGYDEDHKAILVFDKDSMKEIDVGDHLLTGTSNPENTNGPIIEDKDGIEKPTFGNGDDDKNGDEVEKTGKTDNPQTGDTTSIILYLLLLIGSLIPLAVKFRRHIFN